MSEAELARDAAVWVDSVMRGLPLERKVGQLLMVPLQGTYAPDDRRGVESARQTINRVAVGGFVVSAGAPVEIATRTNALQRASRLPLWFASEDLSRGVPYSPSGSSGYQAEGEVEYFPSNMGIAATGDPANARRAGHASARRAREVGVHLLLAPVVDVNPASGRIDLDTYGSDPASVARFAAEFSHGAHEGGAFTSTTHAAGAGATQAAVTSEAREPSGSITVADLRETNSLRDQTAAAGEAGVRAVQGGADVLIASADVALVHAAIVHAVKSGRLPTARIDSAVARVLHAKAKLRLHRTRVVQPDRVDPAGSVNQQAVARDIAQKAITLVHDPAGVVPLDPRRIRRVALIAFTDPEDPLGGRSFAEQLRAIYGNVSFTRIDQNAADYVFEDAYRSALSADAIVVGYYTMSRPGAVPQIPGAIERLAVRVAESGRPHIAVAFGDPAAAARIAAGGTYMIAWHPRAGAVQEAAARAIAGVAPIRGRLPVAIGNAPRYSGLTRDSLRTILTAAAPAEVGMDAHALARVDSIIEAAIADGASPGAAIAIGRHGRLVRLRGYGRLDYRPRFGAVTDSSLYDLASLTKVVATTTAAMLLVDDGVLDLNAPIKRYLPEWRGSSVKEAITVRNLLLHNSGITAGRPLWRTVHNREDALRTIAGLSLEYTPGTRTVYSDFGMILMALVIERVSGSTLDVLLAERVFKPLGMRETLFNPLGQTIAAATGKGMTCCTGEASSPWFPRIAPTEVDRTYRRQHMHGRVHDENAFAIGGVAGHAGLFSSARDLAVFAQMLLNGGYYDGRRIVDPQTLAYFTTRADPRFSRALGWDTPDPVQSLNSSAGGYFSSGSYGHTGFTGTSIWVDPEHDLFVVLLTNRVNPTRENNRHIQLRIAVADAVQLAVTDQSVSKRR